MSEATQAPTTNEPSLTVFMLVKTQPVWLELPVEKRFAEGDKYLKPILQKHAGIVTLRMFDTEFYATRVTLLWMWETSSRHAYELVVEEFVRPRSGITTSASWSFCLRSRTRLRVTTSAQP